MPPRKKKVVAPGVRTPGVEDFHRDIMKLLTKDMPEPQPPSRKKASKKTQEAKD